MKTNLMIYFLNDQDKFEISYKLKMLVRTAIKESLAYEGYHNATELSVTFTDDEGIRVLNRDFRKLDRATDVLSFPLTDYAGTALPIDEPEASLGDIVISLERAAAQAEEYGHSFEREVAFLTVHSMLHLLGYDHEDGGEEEQDMRARQSAILKNMGLEIK